MPSAYTDVVFTDAAKGITAKKLNLLRDDLSTAIGAAGGGGGGTGDMTKAVYDTNNNGKVDTCDSVPWTSVTGVPTTFPPTPGPPQAHQASHVSGTDQIPSASTSVRGLMPVANGNPNAFYGSDGTQKQVAYTMLSGSQPGPVAHALSHLDNGTDVIPVVTATRTGLTPKLSGSAATFLDGTGAFSTPAGGGGGDMLKSVYDTNNDGIADKAAVLSTVGAAHQFWKNGNVWGQPDWSDLTNVPSPGFISKSALYTLTIADNGKYVICSGGSWTLTLPAPATGLNYQVRNDMGISGTTGMITLAPAGGTIDGLASKALLPQQECTLLTDGTNWRTFGLKREVILGTQDITSSTASGSVLLPVGYRYFELQFSGIVPVTANDAMVGQFSLNSGSTWLTTSNYTGNLYNSTATLANFSDQENVSQIALIPGMNSTGGCPGQAKVIIYPGAATLWPSCIVDGGSRNSTPFQSKWLVFGANATAGPINAIKYFMQSGNIANSFLTVKGVV